MTDVNGFACVRKLTKTVIALEKATHDTDKEVAERATLALKADVHHQMAIQIGTIEPDTDLIRICKQMNILGYGEEQPFQVDLVGLHPKDWCLHLPSI